MKRTIILQAFLFFLFISPVLNADEVLFENFEWGSSLNGYNCSVSLAFDRNRFYLAFVNFSNPYNLVHNLGKYKEFEREVVEILYQYFNLNLSTKNNDNKWNFSNNCELTLYPGGDVSFILLNNSYRN